MLIDFRCHIVKGQAVEQYDKYKYLDMFIDDKLSFEHKTEDFQEGQHILFVLYKPSQALWLIICTYFIESNSLQAVNCEQKQPKLLDKNWQ